MLEDFAGDTNWACSTALLGAELVLSYATVGLSVKSRTVWGRVVQWFRCSGVPFLTSCNVHGIYAEIRLGSRGSVVGIKRISQARPDGHMLQPSRSPDFIAFNVSWLRVRNSIWSPHFMFFNVTNDDGLKNCGRCLD